MTRKLPLVIDTPEKIKALRKSMNLRQGEFWGRIGVTQSGGSRYESGRNIPLSTLMLVQIVYGERHDSTALIRYLREACVD